MSEERCRKLKQIKRVKRDCIIFPQRTDAININLAGWSRGPLFVFIILGRFPFELLKTIQPMGDTILHNSFVVANK